MTLSVPPVMRDGEVSLLPLDSAVVNLLVAASRDEVITRWTQIPPSLTMVDAGLVAAGWASNAHAVRLQVCLGDLAPAGMVTVWVNAAGEAEVGYWLLEQARGRGVARRALSLLCDWAFSDAGVERLQLTTLPGNLASEHVAAACGFQPEGAVERDVKGTPRWLRVWVREAAPRSAHSALTGSRSLP